MKIIINLLVRLFGPMPVAVARPDELFSGVEKPTTTLAKMMAATIVEELPEGRPIHDRYSYSNWSRYETSKFHVTIKTDSASHHPETGQGFGRHIKIWVIKDLGFRGVVLSFDETQIVGKAIESVNGLLEARRKAEAAALVQHKAVDALAAWCGVSEVKKEEGKDDTVGAKSEPASLSGKRGAEAPTGRAERGVLLSLE